MRSGNGAGQGIGNGGPARGYKWPQATENNEIALQHGIYSERRVLPIAEQIEEQLLAQPNAPAYLRDPLYAHALRGWSVAEAQQALLLAYIDAAEDPEAPLTDFTTSEESEHHGEGGVTTRKSSTRHLEAAYVQMHRVATRAANLRRELGLTPLARARLPRGFGEAQIDIVKLWAAQAAREQAGDGDGEEAEVPAYASAVPARTRADRRRH